MKGVFLFCTKLKVYLIELPIILLLGITVHFNGNAEGLFKFYPLIVILSLAILFIAVYFFRGVYISVDEISDIGLFSGRESELIKKDATLVLTLRSGGRMNVDLWNHSDSPAFDWMKAEDDLTRDVRVYHRITIAGKRSAERILSMLGAEESLLTELTERDGASLDNGIVSVSSRQLHDCFEIRVKFLKTVI